MSAPTDAHKETRRKIVFDLTPLEGAQLIADSEAQAVAPHLHIATQLAGVLNECGAPEFANAEHAAQWAKDIAGLRAERDQLRAERDALLEITWLDTPDTPHETVAQWRAEFEMGWERKAICDQLRAEVAALVVTKDRACVAAADNKAEADQWHAELRRAEREVERLRKVCNQDAATFARLIARAERAEASLHALRLVCGTTDADKFSTWVDRANARAEKAEALLKGWNDAADASRQPDAFYDGYSEAQMRAMQAMLTKAEAERIALVKANAELDHDYRLLHGRLVTAQAELAAERARLDHILKLRCEDETREQIDAAMEEGA